MTLLLASGGLDSALIAAEFGPSLHLTVDYGQPHAREIDAARAVAEHYGAEHVVVRCALPPVGGLPAMIVPGRNAVLLALATSFALAHGHRVVLIGCNKTDAGDYSDCRPAFIRAVHALAYDTYGITIEAPLLGMTKRDIGAQVRRLKVPARLTWSCYRGLDAPCQDCGACAARQEAGF
jgi:7-cyano-7-deazaguanine synthase